ncbi:hypothetical protein ASD78_13850 [Lysobacter sp. Root667]|uniref:hypothetical protein n=1 Tax=Lysobacter sp. Root667 TaxID=1736581 RepID=UPI0006FCB548|nr:hypothetical protein [Lysobacter sp. Root667]KRA74541.1 hypothetical protein ASD78_13850 [Lysobacter sp. Root667]
MPPRTHELAFAPGRHACSLQAAASRVFAVLGIARYRLIEKTGPGQAFDRYWEGRRDGAVCRVRGSDWDPQRPQARIHVELSDAAAAAAWLQVLHRFGDSQGWGAAEIADA